MKFDNIIISNRLDRRCNPAMSIAEHKLFILIDKIKR